MEYQQRRLERERKQRMAARKMGLKQYYYNFWLQHSKQSPNILFPGGWDDSRVEDIAPIQDLIEDDNHGPVTQERWEGKVPEIIEFLTQRTSEIEKKLLNWYTASYKQWHKTRPGAPPISDRESDTFDGKGHLDLRRATVVFKCTRCDEPMWYPACFQHKDCFSWQKWSTVTSSNWKPGCPGPLGLTFDPTLTLTVSHLLAQLSIDPVTIASIDLPPPLNPLSPPWVTRENYVCLFCDDDDKYLGCMPQLIEHFRKEIDNFQVREGAIARLGRKAFSKLEEGQETPTLRNDHDLSVIRTPTALWRRVTWDEATVIRERNNSFTLRVQKYYSPEYYSITAKYFQKGLNYKCLLCPKVRREKYYTIGLMLNHVKMKHGIDVEKELAVKCTEVEQVEMQAGLAVDTLMDVDDDAVLAGGEL
ncbi:hypothetical protein FRC03_004837 [Tulasnella sp. 419]|nr:hypothetical protein FRC03_004837 [Tulasnella sp. 419]